MPESDPATPPVDSLGAALAHVAGAWERGISHELRFWEEFIESEGGRWNDPEMVVDFRVRLDREALLDEDLIVERLSAIPDHEISVLDVGAGPLTLLGKRYPGKSLRIVAVDPLAREYDRLLERANIAPPVRTELCHGEQLLTRFSPNSFDFAYARNALDHSYDPLLIVSNMVVLVKENRFVLLKHFKNEAENANYKGLHQWNFDIREGRLVLWSGTSGIEYDLADEFKDRARVESSYEGGWVTCVLTKRSP